MIMEENFLFELDQSCKGDVIFLGAQETTIKRKYKPGVVPWCSMSVISVLGSLRRRVMSLRHIYRYLSIDMYISISILPQERKTPYLSQPGSKLSCQPFSRL
jgi:hypothetical protein